jgi:type II secretory pathway pseudopilin PulG
MSSGHNILRQVRSALHTERGFTMVEALIAVTLFLVITTALMGVLTSSIASHKGARERTMAEQTVTSEIEAARQLSYTDVGLVGGNPPGQLQATKSTTLPKGLKGTITTQVTYVDDPTPTSYSTLSNYKKVTVTVTRNSDSKQLSRQVTYIAPPERAPYGGINNAIINAYVKDFGTGLAYSGALVELKNGPSSDRSDTSSATGLVTFPALDPNTGPKPYYDLYVTAAGYKTLKEDLAPTSANAHLALAPSETKTTTINIYKPFTLTVLFKDTLGSPWTGGGTLTVGSPRGVQEFTFTGGESSKTITQVNGEDLVPTYNYTVAARASLPGSKEYYTPLVSAVVPNNPTPPQSTFTTVFPVTFWSTCTSPATCTRRVLTVQVRKSGAAVANARVDVSGGLANTYVTALTNGSGNAVINLPSGLLSTYTVKAWGPSGAETVYSPSPTLTANTSITVNVT